MDKVEAQLAISTYTRKTYEIRSREGSFTYDRTESTAERGVSIDQLSPTELAEGYDQALGRAQEVLRLESKLKRGTKLAGFIVGILGGGTVSGLLASYEPGSKQIPVTVASVFIGASLLGRTMYDWFGRDYEGGVAQAAWRVEQLQQMEPTIHVLTQATAG